MPPIDPPFRARNRTLDIVAIALVSLIAAVIAFGYFRAYYADLGSLWRGIDSDRNVHFGNAMRMALALRNLDAAWVLAELQTSLIYPPLNALVLGLVLLIGDFDPRLATIPSLVAWIAMVVLTFALARRLFADRVLGLFAGAVAAIFALASPTLRLLAADVMLEAGGAALTAAALWFYISACGAPTDDRRWRALALTLTALFYFKSNFWGLAVAALAITHLAADPCGWTEHARDAIARLNWRTSARWILRQPLLFLALMLGAAVVAILLLKPAPFEIARIKISVYPPDRLISIAIAVLYLWAALAWYRRRATINSLLGVPGRAILYWHVVPAALSFLVPHRLSWLLWHTGPTIAAGKGIDLGDAWREYAGAMAQGFHVATWAAVLAGALFLVALAQIRRLKPEQRAPFLLVLVSATAVILHPNHQGRFLATFIFAMWVCAGAGAAFLLEWLIASHARLRTVVAGLAIAALAAASIAQKPSSAAAAYAIQTPGPSEFEVSEIFLPLLRGTPRIGILPADPGKFRFFVWNVQRQCRCRTPPDQIQYLVEPLRDDLEAKVREWIARTPSQRVVALLAPDSPLLPWIADAMTAGGRFELTFERAVPSHRTTVMIWRRRDTPRS